MIRWHCPRCGFEHDTNDDVVGVQHPCPREPGMELVRFVSGRFKVLELYCGRCRALFKVRDDDIVDGEVWQCETCRPAIVEQVMQGA